MRTRSSAPLTLATVLGLLGALALSGAVLAAETTLTATLAGVQEGDAPGDPDGSGSATVVLDPEAGTACWDITAENIMPVNISHIHDGAAGESGPIVVDLDLDGFEGTSEGCTEGVDAAVLQGIIDSPADFYVNLHTDDFPAGAIRGQLAASATPPNTALPSTDGTPLAVLGALLLLAAVAVGLRLAAPMAVRDRD